MWRPTFRAPPVSNPSHTMHAGNRMRSGSALVLAELLRSFFLLDINSISSAMHKHTQSIAAAAAAAEDTSNTGCPSTSRTSSGALTCSAAASSTLQERQNVLYAAVSALPTRQVVLTGNPLGMAGARCFPSLPSSPCETCGGQLQKPTTVVFKRYSIEYRTCPNYCSEHVVFGVQLRVGAPSERGPRYLLLLKIALQCLKCAPRYNIKRSPAT